MSDETTNGTIWTEADSASYRELATIAVPARTEQLATLLTLLPFDKDAAFRVVELASGEGLLAQAILDCFPHASLLALDGAASMRQQTAQRLAQFGARAEVAAFDIAAPDWQARVQGADCVVSSLCVHHLNGPAKQRLFRAMSACLSARGALLIADLVLPQRSEARELFAATWDRNAAEQSQVQTGTTTLYDRFVIAEWNYYRYPDPVDQPSPLFDQLVWLKDAGFAIVDCFWLRAGHAIYGGYKAHAAATSVTFADAMQSAQRAMRA